MNKIKKREKTGMALLGVLFLLSGCFWLTIQTDASAVPSQITDFQPQVWEEKVQGSIENSAGAKVEVTITHPGVGMTKSELDRMRDHVRAGDEPWTMAFEKFAANAKCSVTPRIYYENNDDFIYVPNVWTNNARKEYVTMRGNFDAATAVCQSIMWYITGNEAYRKNCMNIIRLWSQIQSITPEKDFRWGITDYNMAFAAEIMRYSQGQTEETKWTDQDTENFTRFLNLGLRASRYTTYFWMNQQCFANMGILSTGIFENDFTLYAVGVEQTTVNKNGAQGGNNGSIKYQCRLMTINEETGEEIPLEKQRVQLIESGRDQGHAWATASGLSTLVQSIYLQNTFVDPVTGEISDREDAVNPFQFLDDRVLKGVTTALRYNLGYDDEWITADSGRGFYREPSSASWRGRVNECLGILYNYYRYIEHRDMSSEELKDLKRAYEKYMPEVKTSDDFPLCATLLYTPDEAKDQYTQGTVYEDTAYVKQLENYTGEISKSAEVFSENEITYVRTTPGTEIVTASGWPAEGNIGIRVRTSKAACIEVRRDRKNYAPKAVFYIPDTKGEWVTVVTDTTGSSYSAGDFIYLKISGDADWVDLDYIDFKAANPPKLELSSTKQTAGDGVKGEERYLIKVENTGTFQFSSMMDQVTYQADSSLKNCTINSQGLLTVRPSDKECEKEWTVLVSANKDGIVSSEIVKIFPYKDKTAVIKKYEEDYHPLTAEYTKKSKTEYETARKELQSIVGDENAALQKYIDAFRNLQGLLASYDFEKAENGSFEDISGNGKSGTLYHNARIEEDELQQSGVLILDGSAESYARLPDGLFDGCAEATIEFDVKASVTDGNFHTFGIGTDEYNYTYFKTEEADSKVKITRYSYEKEEGVLVNRAVGKEQWINVKIVYEKDKIRLYLNNEYVGGEDTGSSIADLGTSLKCYLGKSFYLWDQYFCGSFDNLKVYNYAFSKSQIQQEEKKVSVHYVVSAGAYLKGKAQQTVLQGESAEKISLILYDGYEFYGWSDGNTNLTRQEKYLAEDKTLYADIRRKAGEESVEFCYDFENSDGTRIWDSIGNGNVMTLNGNAKIVKDSQTKSNVLYLDGSLDTYAMFPEGFFDGRNTFTLCMDVKAVKADKSKNYFTFALGQNETNYFFVKINEDSVKSAMTTGSWKNEYGLTSNTSYATKDTWMSLTIVISDSSMKIYQNGVLLGERSDGEITMEKLGNHLVSYLGKSFYSTDEYFEGYFDNICLYNYAMSDGEISGKEKRKKKVSYTAMTGGRIEGEKIQNLDTGADASTVTAVAKEGYQFVTWSDGIRSPERTDTDIRNDLSVSALFERTKMTYSEGLVADYEMSYSEGGVLSNKASMDGRADAKLIGILPSDFISDGEETVLRLTGEKTKYVELPMGILGDDESFSIETCFQTDVLAFHWLYCIGSIVDQKNYLMVNPKAPDGKMSVSIKDDVTEEFITQGTTEISTGYHTVVLTFEDGYISLYLDGGRIGEKRTSYTIKELFEKGVADGCCGFIGKSLYSSDPGFCGSVQSFKVFDCALTSERVKERYEGIEKDHMIDPPSEEEDLKEEETKEEDPKNPEKENQNPQRVNPVSRMTAKQNQNTLSVKLSWKKVKGSCGYVIYRSLKKNSGFTKIAQVNASKQSYTDHAVKPGKNYYYKIVVKGKTAAQNSTLNKNPASVWILAKPVLKKTVKKNVITLSWKKIKGASGYTVYGSSNNKKFKVVVTLKKSSKTKTSIKMKKSQKKYYIRLCPYKTVKGKKVYGTSSKTFLIKRK